MESNIAAAPRRNNNLVISEHLLRALLISHLLAHPAIGLVSLNREIKDVKYDAKSKMVTFTFSKEEAEK